MFETMFIYDTWLCRCFVMRITYIYRLTPTECPEVTLLATIRNK